MGRIRGLFCSCLENGADHSNGEPAFDRNLDVSHLATPHITSTIDRTTTPNICEISAEDDYSKNHTGHQRQQTRHQQQPYQAQQPEQHPLNGHHDQGEQHLGESSGTSHVRPPSSLNLETTSSSQPSSSSPFAPSPVNNLYEPPVPHENNQHNHAPPSVSPESQLQHNLHPSPNDNQAEPQPPPPPPPIIARNPPPSTSNGTTAKLSYDIISVREPLAKILAERQQLLHSQQQQRQILGDHEYIEVYGERGSSCFYEEIAGSVTSSATYDQIGAASNHNYQVLINAYAVASRQPGGNPGDENNSCDGPSDSNNNQQDENAYDVTSHPSDQIDAGPSTSNGMRAHVKETGDKQDASPKQYDQKGSSHPDNSQLTQSMPVYSVINKATRRSSSIMRPPFDNIRPPEPPPKNLFVNQQPSTSAIYNEPSMSALNQSNNSASRARSPVVQIPSTSSYSEVKREPTASSDSPSGHRNSRLPQPPPRYSKQPGFNHTTDRPLPSPNKLESLNHNNNNNNNNSSLLDQNPNLGEQDDIESLNNGYELLRSNLDDDQIDVGYEKIRESNRYSGGSISSQFYSRQLIDNDGYESVQPIYSSPSNCYEVLNPATASEIAAAAAAKLNVIEKFLKKDQ